MITRSAPFFLLASLLALTACPPAPLPEPLEPPPRVGAFSASAQEVASGATVTLTWQVEGATEVQVSEVTLGTLSGVSGLEGSVEVAITRTSLFVLTATNARGATDTAVVVVRVLGEATDLLFSATPSSVQAGEPVTLAWSAPGAASVSLTAAPGGAVDTLSQVTSGSVVVRPSATTTWTLAAGGRTAAATVTVSATISSFTATPASAAAGGTVTLSWATSNAERVELIAPGRAPLVDTTDPAELAAGTVDDLLPGTVDPGQYFPYELRVTAGASTITRQVVVSIAGNPAITALNVPERARASDGGVVSVSWSTVQSDSLSISLDGAEVYRAPTFALVANGSVELPVPAVGTATLVITASNSRGGSISQMRQLELVGQPSVSLTVSPATVAPGETFALSWAGAEINALRIFDDEDQVIYALDTPADTGSLPSLGASRTTRFRIVADNTVGDLAEATATVTVNGSVAFTQSPAGALRSGQDVALGWTFFNGAQVLGVPHPDVTLRPGSTGFDDISSTGTALAFGEADDAVATFQPPGFLAPFWGRLVGSTVTVSTNGYLTFGGQVNAENYSDVALPSAKLEPYSLAPYWEDLSLGTGEVFWEVKPAGTERVLIVQWNQVVYLTSTLQTFQVKLRTDGQVDFEYGALGSVIGKAGVQGPLGPLGYAITPASNLGVTFFAPKPSPVTVRPQFELPMTAFFRVNGALVPVRHDFGTVVRPEDLFISEALVRPATAVGPTGAWFELFNARDTALSLTGWTLTQPDGGQAPLSGTVPARGVLLAGLSTDPALNDDAGVQVELPGLTPRSAGDSLTLGRDGPLSTFTWPNQPTAGTSVVHDPGPYRFALSANVLPQLCVSQDSFGELQPRQVGSPGLVEDCGFPYRWRHLPARYHDISRTGTLAVLSSRDTAILQLSLAAAPFIYFGVPRLAARVSTNGFISFDTGTSNPTFTSAYPSTTDANLLLVPYGDDLEGVRPDSAIYTQRLGPNEDPDVPEAHWIVQWHHWSSSFDTGDLNFQVKLFDSGVIEFHYAQMTSTTVTSYGTGASAVTWIENATGSQALVLNANSTTPGISPHSAFRFSPR